MGKLGSRDLKRLLGCIRKDSRVIVPPMLGFDSGVHLIDDKCLVVSTDPCIGVPVKWFGWLLINYAASDVALFGAKPQFCTINLLGPPKTEPRTFQEVMQQACKASEELDLAIVTGHTGAYEGLSRLVGACTVYGIVEKSRLITPGNAKAGDCILCTKPVGLEVVVNLALMNKPLAKKLFGAKQTQRLERLVTMQSCVKEALLLAGMGGVHSMHDATEGGLIAALNEMAEASEVGFTIKNEHIPVCKEVKKIQRIFHLSNEEVLAMSSTGTILAAVNPSNKSDVAEALQKHGFQASFLGFFSEDMERVLTKDGKKTKFPEEAEDPYERILSGAL